MADSQNRNGPPPPRAEKPWQPEPKQYAARDAACDAFIVEHFEHFEHSYHNSMVIAAIKDGFNAGWAARKQADYEIVLGIRKRLDKRSAIPDTLFPTTGELP